jgi:hypothetical protein
MSVSSAHGRTATVKSGSAGGTKLANRITRNGRTRLARLCHPNSWRKKDAKHRADKGQSPGDKGRPRATPGGSSPGVLVGPPWLERPRRPAGLVRQVHRSHRQQGQHKQGSCYQLHAQAVAVVVDVRAGFAAGRTATLRDRPSTLGADQVLAAHPAPTGHTGRPGHFDDVGRSKPVSPLDWPEAKPGRVISRNASTQYPVYLVRWASDPLR